MSHTVSPSALLEVIRREANNSGAAFTIKSLKTGKDYTYQISRSEFKGKWYTHIKVETEYQNYRRLGTYFAGAIKLKGQAVDSPSAVAIAWVLSKVESMRFEELAEKIQIMHTGNCLVCGKTLTDATSIEIGLGPVCRSGK